MPSPILEYQGRPISDLFDDLIAADVQESVATGVIAGLLLESVGKTRRRFAYDAPFPAEDPACASSFARTFEHEDWIDGESVVQAETTASELGFNARFHRIERDIDTLGQELARAFACIGEIREGLHDALEEIKAELNRVNGDIHACCHDAPGPVRPLPFPGGGLQPIPINPPVLTPGGPLTPTNPFPFGPGGGYYGYPTGTVYPVDFGVQEIEGVRYEILYDRGELVVMPADVVVAAGEGITLEGGMSGFVARDEVQDVFASGGLTAAEVRERFGDDVLPGGGTVADALRGADSRTRFASADDLVSEVGRLRTEEALASGDRAEAISKLGLPAEGTAEARVETFGALSKKERLALKRAGVSSVGQLATMDAQDVARAARRGGAVLSTAEAARVAGLARTAGRLGGFGR